MAEKKLEERIDLVNKNLDNLKKQLLQAQQLVETLVINIAKYQGQLELLQTMIRQRDGLEE